MIKNSFTKFNKLLGSDFRDLLKHSRNYLTADIFNQSLSLISVPIFTRLLVPEDYGILAILASFISIFSIIYGLGIRGSVTRYYYEKNNDLNEFLGSISSLLFGFGICLTIILLLSKEYLLVFFRVPVKIIYIGIATVFFQVFFQVYQALLVAKKESKRVAILTIIRRTLNIIIAVFLIIQLDSEKFYGHAFATLISIIVLGSYSVYHLFQILKISLNKFHLVYALSFSLPIVLHLLSGYILGHFDQIIINQLVGKLETGLYSIAYAVGSVMSFIIGAIGRAWSPEFYGKLNDKKYNDIENLVSKTSKLIYISAMGMILFVQEIFIVMADIKYHEAINIVPIIVVSFVFVFMYQQYVNYAFYHKKTKLIAVFTIIAGGINIGLNYWLIPIWGYKVAAWTTLISYACLFGLHYINVKYIIKPEWILGLKVLLPNFVVLIGFVLLFSFIEHFKLSIFIILAVKVLFISGLFIVYFRKKLKSLLE